MLRDIEYFQTKLQHIDGFGETGNYLRDIIKAKQVKSASPPTSSETKSEAGEAAAGFDAPKVKSSSPPPPTEAEPEKQAEAAEDGKEPKDNEGDSKEPSSSDAK